MANVVGMEKMSEKETREASGSRGSWISYYFIDPQKLFFSIFHMADVVQEFCTFLHLKSLNPC